MAKGQEEDSESSMGVLEKAKVMVGLHGASAVYLHMYVSVP